jgi:hypothetical protein
MISMNLFGQNLTKKELKYCPKDLNEALTQLNKITPDSIKVKIISMTENDFIAQTHFTTGMWIRNEWLYNRYLFGLVVTKSELRKDLSAKGLFSNDDMSGVILRSFHRQLSGVDINLDQQIQDIYQWYANMNNLEWRAEQDSIYWANFMIKFEVGDTLTRNVYYNRNWLGESRNNVVVHAIITGKSDNKLQISIISFGGELNENLIYKEIGCDSSDCWVNPHSWKKENDKN